MPNKMMTIIEAAETIGCSPSAIRKWLNNEEKRVQYLPGAVKVESLQSNFSGRWEIPAHEVEALKERFRSDTGKPWPFAEAHVIPLKVSVSVPPGEWSEFWPLIKSQLTAQERWTLLKNEAISRSQFGNGSAA